MHSEYVAKKTQVFYKIRSTWWIKRIFYTLSHETINLNSLLLILLILECIFREQQWFLFNLLYVSSRRIQWHPTPVLLPGKSHGWRSLVGCSHGVAKSRARLSDFTFTFHFHALAKEMATHSSILAWRPRDGGAWWAAVYGVAQSRTQLRWLSSSSGHLDAINQNQVGIVALAWAKWTENTCFLLLSGNLLEGHLRKFSAPRRSLQ